MKDFNFKKIADLREQYKNLYKIIIRLLLVSASNIKNVKCIKFNLNNILLFDYLEYVKINH